MAAAFIHGDRKDNAQPVVTVRIAGYHGWMAGAHHSEAFLNRLALFLTQKTADKKPIKVSRTSEVYRWRDEETVLYVKRYLCRGMRLSLQTRLGVNKAQKSWRTGRHLLALGIDTPPPVFYLRRSISAFKSEHVFAAESVQNSLSLRDYVHSHFVENRLTRRQKQIFLSGAAHFLGHLHLAGIYHGDLTARNILVQPFDDVTDTRFFLIDLDAIRSTGWISRRRRIKNLDELGRNFLDLRQIGTTDRARFVKHYLEVYHKEKGGFKRLLNDVCHRTARRLVKHGQRFTV